MSLACGETEARLIDFVDNRLDPSYAAIVLEHIDGCNACRQKSDLWRALVPGMRSFVPSRLGDLQARRLENEITRRLEDQAAAPARLQRRGVLIVGALVLTCAAAALAFWVSPRMASLLPGATGGVFARVTRVEGGVTSRGSGVAASSVLTAGSEIAVSMGGEVELLLERGARLRLFGPARATLVGIARDIEVRLASGTVQADVAHRLSNETFAVVTRDARVEVRGTRFVVAVGSGGSWVRVDEGLVRVHFADGRQRLVAAGEVAGSETSPDNPLGEDEPADDNVPEAAAPTPSCAVAARSCQKVARHVRDNMRRGDHDRALGLIATARRSAAEIGSSCAAVSACQDELGYLGAESLRGAGRISDAVRAFKSLNRAGAPADMRQNALYAAAELERSQGRTAEARTDYERALASAPRGALREEALVGSMESADFSGDRSRSTVLARRYLAEFPEGRAASRARRILGEAPRNHAGGEQR